MKKLLLFLCLLAHTGLSQSTQIDSLKRELVLLDKNPSGYARDTLRYQTLKAVMRAYSDVNVDSSMHYNTLMIGLCKGSGLQKELVYAYQYAGYLYQIRGDYHQSIRFHYKALPLAEKLKMHTRIAASHGALAHAYTSLKEYARATKLCKQGLAVLSHYPDAVIQLSILNVLGVIYREQSQLLNALKINQTMYNLAQSKHNVWYEAHGLHAIGLVYKDMGDLPKALDYHKKALVLARKTGSIELEGNILLNTTDLYARQHQWKQALAYCMQAKQMAIQVKNSSIVAEADEKLYKIFKQTSQPDKALEAHERFVFLRDSLSKDKNQQRIETLQAQYDNVQKTNALLAQKNKYQQLAQTRNGLFLGIAATLLLALLLFWNNRRLQAKNVEINQQRALLESARKQLADINRTLEIRVDDRTKDLVKANRELIQKNEEIKGALFKGQTIERKRVALELHDNLSSLLSAVNMSIQAINPQNLSEPEQSVYRNVRQLIQNAYAEVRNISHNILPAELDREGLATTLTTLVGQLNQNSPLQFSLTITGLQERLPVEIEFNVYSIVLELINNTIKHARATTVGISLFRTDTGINLSVIDDGIGMGHNPNKPGIGLQNIQARLDSLGGILTTVLSAEKGTRILIKIPIETVRFNGD
ncbi:tetratricopeptide repeat-containing sensor histidine kinase [Spirosoma pollinicola]|uniref:Two-component sensor histidine kinase n=1 Tax=Spirosoma pollinicola TaxID=2057025 RepID=A0A2K8Z5L7_9BACT|nr:sensor histidine kinase [Spirosoma pollinicola]AUD05138.1 two-component sensor histidine kinase [Spirosoma pollinicola]